MTVRISAVICTHNRATYLVRSIGSLINQTLANDQYEIVVVDNASTDNTRSVVADCANQLSIRYVHEPVLGIARARNTGWRSVQAPYLAYLDDDAVAEPDWLEKILAAFPLFGRNAGCLGGPIRPIWEAEQPRWLSDKMLTAFSIYHYSDVPTVLNRQQFLSSCNIAYPVDVLRVTGGFREDLGRRGGSLMGNEEPDLTNRIEALGYLSVYHPEVVVWHHIQSAKLSKPWFRRYWYSQGRSTALMENPAEHPLSRRERTQSALRKTVWALPRIPLMLNPVDPAAGFRRQCQTLEVAGYVLGMIR